MRATTADAAAAEHDALFHGVGKPEVFAYGSFYLTGYLNESRWPRCAPTWPRWAWRATATGWRPRTTSPTCSR
jgi:hypothetical protein